MRGATGPGRGPGRSPGVSIHAPRAGRDRSSSLIHVFSTNVSIHAPRAGRDWQPSSTARTAAGFNPRAPCGARLNDTRLVADETEFQSTRPVRGATPTPARLSHARGVSIHAPRAGRDIYLSRCFNPRAPCGARLPVLQRRRREEGVSIHAPRAGRDAASSTAPPGRAGFNPRAPCGARPPPPHACHTREGFQSTRPVRGATRPVRGATRAPRLSTGPITGFNPRAPCGARRGGCVDVRYGRDVSIHAPRAGRDHGERVA